MSALAAILKSKLGLKSCFYKNSNSRRIPFLTSFYRPHEFHVLNRTLTSHPSHLTSYLSAFTFHISPPCHFYSHSSRGPSHDSLQFWAKLTSSAADRAAAAYAFYNVVMPGREAPSYNYVRNAYNRSSSRRREPKTVKHLFDTSVSSGRG